MTPMFVYISSLVYKSLRERMLLIMFGTNVFMCTYVVRCRWKSLFSKHHSNHYLHHYSHQRLIRFYNSQNYYCKQWIRLIYYKNHSWINHINNEEKEIEWIVYVCAILCYEVSICVRAFVLNIQLVENNECEYVPSIQNRRR